MRVFEATHKLVAPAGEQIPVMLLSQKDRVRYLVMTPENYEDQSFPVYEWHPSEGVTYQGFYLDGLMIVELSCESLPSSASQPGTRVSL
ncbi:MAG: hypothetical protein KME19_19670 [Microcoleus vaginatus WJT46-NPBG5]|jgi:hypothetical protein|nr:hypothetical protein [Microcoleus vaginatus WJT46-NPBG5]